VHALAVTVNVFTYAYSKKNMKSFNSSSVKPDCKCLVIIIMPLPTLTTTFSGSLSFCLYIWDSRKRDLKCWGFTVRKTRNDFIVSKLSFLNHNHITSDTPKNLRYFHTEYTALLQQKASWGFIWRIMRPNESINGYSHP